jgi:hypothetical protein
MKNISLRQIKPARAAALLACFLAFAACNKEVDPQTDLEPYAETELDAAGGNWKTFVLTDAGEIAVPAPESETSAAYLAELQEVAGMSGAPLEEQRAIARYWGAGGVLRWHEIARELAAEYNVPPNYNPDGTYPKPDPANPGAYPRLPFANPPFTARALALLSIAQYDALVATWKYKYQYNRRAPYHNDPAVNSVLPVTDLPSYPSEDAVIAAASREVLKFLFPNEKVFLDERAAEHKESRLWAGANVRSDLDAGEALGAAVAAKIIAYAKTDGMGGAGNPDALAALRADATARGITTQWLSLDLPARYPMLPYYGKVKTWNFNGDQLVTIRPPAPPAIGSAEFETALNELRDLSDNRTREQFRIASYWADGVGSYTPPGHWDRTASDLIYEHRLNELRAARTMALLNSAMQDAGIACWDAKFYYMLPRPTQVDPSIRTSTGIPNFPSYTSGHSTFSAAAATVLAHLFPDHADEVDALAQEASVSRVYGGIHYRFDCTAGLVCGNAVGNFAVERAKQDGAE